MDYVVVSETEDAIVRYNTEHKFVYHTILKNIDGEPIQNVLNLGLDTFKEHNCIGWMADDRLNGPVIEEDVVFSLTDWGPRAAAEGWKYWALVVPEQVAAQASMMDVIKAYHQLGVQVQVFVDIPTAEAWLTNKIQEDISAS